MAAVLDVMAAESNTVAEASLQRPKESKISARALCLMRRLYLPGTLPSLANYQNPPLVYRRRSRCQQQTLARSSIGRSLSVIYMYNEDASAIRRTRTVMVNTYLDTGFSRPNFATVSLNASLGSLNLIMLRRSTSRLRKNLCTNFRAE